MEDRVRRNSSEKINHKIDDKIRNSITQYATADKASISKRIKELENEWDTERVLEVNMPIVALIGLSLGIFVNQWWFIFPAVVMLFFLQHAIQGWCPPLPIFRSLGYRTKQEIHKELYALKLLRGDFNEVNHIPKATVEAEKIYNAISM
jgi:hypothetical protein